MIQLKQATAVTVKVGPFVDATDGVTAETALTISQADVRLAKNGADFAQKNEASAATHDESGYYDIDLDTTDTNTAGVLTLAVSESGALPVRMDFQVVPISVFPEAKRRNTAQAGAAGTITLDASASATNDEFTGDIIVIVGGTGATQWRIITDYVGSTKVATIEPNWLTNPDNTSVFEILASPPSAGLETAVSDGLTNYGAATSSDISTSIGGLNDISTADVNAQVVDALATDTYAEPAAVPAATATLAAKVGWLYALARNKMTQTADTQTLRNDADDGDIATATVSDNGTTFTRGEFASS